MSKEGQNKAGQNKAGKALRAEIIAIGTEILLGDIVNTNASYLARQLASIGIDTYHQEVVGDNAARLKEAFAAAYERSDIVITSGGLGPTGDDLSKETGAEYFGVKLVMDEKARAHIEDYMTRRGRQITENNWKQALLPEGAVPFYNDNGTAPGFALEKDGKILIMLPGPPKELEPMFDKQVLPYLRQKSSFITLSRTLHLTGWGESYIESRLHEAMLSMQNPTLAPYAKLGHVDLRITAKAESAATAMAMIRPVEEKIRQMFPSDVYGADEETLEGCLIGLLKERHLKIATAESCTGGLVGASLVNCPGASEVYQGGIISYANEAKQDLLHVSGETLEKYGAVSEETAGEMAQGAARALGAGVAVSVTGIAGPGGGTPEKPVGTVCFGVYINGTITTSTVHFTRNRNSNREMAAAKALDLVRRALSGESDT